MEKPIFDVTEIPKMSPEMQLRNFFQSIEFSFQSQNMPATSCGCNLRHNAAALAHNQWPSIDIITSKGRKFVAHYNGTEFYRGKMDERDLAENLYTKFSNMRNRFGSAS